MSDRNVDEVFMDQALDLAAQGRGQTSPNPMVGAIIVGADGSVVGTGHHERAGEPHAEVRALAVAGGRAHDATLYCTLEPCSHVGRTGPCAHRIVDAGVRRVVVGLVDPNPLMSGAGIAHLRSHGLEVDVGVRGRDAARLNEIFLTWMKQSRPFVIIKIAVSRDGKISTRTGVRTLLTSDEANRSVHQIRADVDAVGVGSETILVDDPLLTPRLVSRDRPLVRVIFDRRLRTPPRARIFGTLDSGPVAIVTTRDAFLADENKVSVLRAAGARVEPADGNGIAAGLQRLAKQDVTSILLEGGARIHQAAWSAGVVDRVMRFVVPSELGGEAVSWLEEESFEQLCDVRSERLGPDLLIDGYVHRVN